MMSFTCTIFFIFIDALILVTVKADGCFENTEIFKAYTQYIQPSTLENRIYYNLAVVDPKKMTAQNEENLPGYWKKTFTCLEEYEGNRMLVEVHDEKKNKIRYQCLKFKPLTENVIRQSKTKLRSSREKVDCQKDKYLSDQALLMAMDDLQPEPCPLMGGYQMILYEGEIIKGHCLDSIQTYNPSMQFECDSHNVIVDFGRDCEPPILREFQKMRRRHVAHLTCVGNWSESEDVKSVLLHMRDMPYDVWCIHYKKVNNTLNLLSVFMTLDGRCAEDAFNDESFPSDTSMFGHLARYVPSNDPHCSNSQYLDSCKENEVKCFESDQCPANCQRCIGKPSKSSCRFMEDTQGNWRTVDSRQKMTVDVKGDSFDVSGYGKFSCREEADRDLPGRIYPVVQSDEMSSCMPFYACANVVSPIPGVLNFKLQPAWRGKDGTPLSCKGTYDKIGIVTPVEDEQMITMLDFEKLERSSCGFKIGLQFPTIMDACMLTVDDCDGECNELHIHYDNNTCGVHPTMGFEIEMDHVCYGKFHFDDNSKGLLTYSEFSDRYFCWIYGLDHLYISTPNDCNSERAKYISSQREAHVTYDPASRLMKPAQEKSKRYPDGTGVGVQCTSNSILVLLSVYLFVLFSHVNVN